MEIDLTNITLTTLAIIGAVNAYTFFKPGATSKEKFAVSVVVAFVIGFLPAEFAVEVHGRVVEALKAALVASGGYKLVQKVGGK